MQKSLPTNAYVKRGNGFRPVGRFVNKSSQKVSKKRGFHDQFLIAHWKEVVGEDLGKITRPYQMKPSRSAGSTLILECVSGHVSELTMRTEELRIRINTALGGNAVEKIVFRHHVAGFDGDQTTLQSKVHVEKIVPQDVQQRVQNAQSTELQSALRDISKAFYNRGNVNE